MNELAETARRPMLATVLPNALSVGRICVVPLQLYFAFTDQKAAFLLVLLLVFLSDAVDGMLARKLHGASAIGARLDSLGDFATYLSLPVCIWGLWPEIIREEAVFVIAALLSYLLPVTIGFVRFRRLICFHTWGAKASAILVGVTVVLMLFGVSRWPFRLVTPLFVIAGLETIGVTLVLPRWHANVRSLRAALAIRRGERND